MREVEERGILFGDRQVRAILAGRMVETRRPVLPVPEWVAWGDEGWWEWRGEGWPPRVARCPWGVPGDRLYVRECHVVESNREVALEGYGPPFDDGRPVRWVADMDWGRYWEQCHYRATDEEPELAYHDTADPGCRWRASMHMPKWAARIWLEVTVVGVQRIQSVGLYEALREGTPPVMSVMKRYREQWDELYGDREGLRWDDNPWVWVIGFRRIER